MLTLHPDSPAREHLGTAQGYPRGQRGLRTAASPAPLSPFLIADLSHLVITSRGVITLLRQSIGSDPIRREDEAKPATDRTGEARGKGATPWGFLRRSIQAGDAGRCFRPNSSETVFTGSLKKDTVPLHADKTFSLRTIFIIISG